MNQSDGLNEERELFRLIGQGDVNSFTQIFSKYTDRLYSYIIKACKSDIWTEEIVQDVWTQVWVKREKIGSVEEPAAYLFKIAANRTLDWMRHNRLDLKMQYYLKAHSVDKTNDTQEQVEFNQCQQVLLEAIDSLPTQRKLVFRLKNTEGLSYAEIAEQLQISKNTVRNQMVKSLQTIRDHLKEKDDITQIYPLLLIFFFFI